MSGHESLTCGLGDRRKPPPAIWMSVPSAAVRYKRSSCSFQRITIPTGALRNAGASPTCRGPQRPGAVGSCGLTLVSISHTCGEAPRGSETACRCALVVNPSVSVPWLEGERGLVQAIHSAGRARSVIARILLYWECLLVQVPDLRCGGFWATGRNVIGTEAAG